MTSKHLHQPVSSGVVDGFSDVKATVEAFMVCTSKHESELVRLMDVFGDFERRILFEKGVGVDEEGLMPKKLGALHVLLLELTLGLFLKDVTV